MAAIFVACTLQPIEHFLYEIKISISCQLCPKDPKKYAKYREIIAVCGFLTSFLRIFLHFAEWARPRALQSAQSKQALQASKGESGNFFSCCPAVPATELLKIVKFYVQENHVLKPVKQHNVREILWHYLRIF